MPDARHLRAAADGGHLNGGAPRAVWQAAGADPAVVSARSVAERLSELGQASHLTWNPLTGEIIQLVSVLRAGRSLGGPEGLAPLGPARAADSGARPAPAEPAGPGGPAGPGSSAGAGPPAGVNAEGRLCVQICVVAFAWDPFTAGPMTGLRHIMSWLDSWGVARCWPAGPPAAFPQSHAGSRSRRLWAQGGHFGASQVPEWTAAGPGAIDIGKLTGIRPPRAHPEPDRAGPDRAGPDRAGEAGLAAFDDIFEAPGPAPAAGSLTRVG
jgi:hypothetical protein